MSIKQYLLLFALSNIAFTISTKVIEVDSKNFDTVVLQSKIPVILDVYATWCGPCRNMAPIFERVSNDFEGKLLFAKMDYDKSEKLAQKLGVTMLPTFVIYNKGSKTDFIPGSLQEAKLRDLAQSQIK